jgi:hypothetical protein
VQVHLGAAAAARGLAGRRRCSIRRCAGGAGHGQLAAPARSACARRWSARPACAFRGARNLGDENVQLALRLLEEARIPVLDRDVGGARGRKLIFHVDDGAAWVRQL